MVENLAIKIEGEKWGFEYQRKLMLQEKGIEFLLWEKCTIYYININDKVIHNFCSHIIFFLYKAK